LTGNEGRILPTLPLTSNTTTPTGTPSASSSASTSTSASPAATAAAKKIESMMWGSAVKGGAFSFYGLDNEGVPTGYTVTDGTNVQGKLYVTRGLQTQTDSGVVVTGQAITQSGGPNVLLGQTLTVTATGTTYAVNPSVGIKGSWVPLKVSDTTYVIERMSNGNYLVTATILVDSSIEVGITIPTGARGYDVVSAPKSIVTRLVLDATKTRILAQAVSVNDAKGGAR
jgi:hypothetical protein